MKRQTVLVKVGTSTLTKRGNANVVELDRASFAMIGAQIQQLQADGHSVILVSSSAISAGMMATGATERPDGSRDTIPELQALASIGWRHVVGAWADALDQRIGELLITRKELERTAERSELLNVLRQLHTTKFIPLINENDAVSHEEITFGDNDILAAQLAAHLRHATPAEEISVVLLSNIDAVFADYNDATSRIATIDDVAVHAASISPLSSDGGSGGMASKFMAADIATEAGVDVYVANGRNPNAIADVFSGVSGTHFVKT